MFPKKIFTQRLNELLEKNHISKQTLAEALGISRPAVSLICAGTNTPSMDTFLAIADYFFVDPNYLLGRIDESHFQENLLKAEIELLSKLPEQLKVAYNYSKNDLPLEYTSEIIRSFQRFENDKSLSFVESVQKKFKKIISSEYYEILIRYFLQRI